MIRLFLTLLPLLFFTSACSSPGHNYTALKNIETAKEVCNKKNNFSFDTKNEPGIEISFSEYIICVLKKKETRLDSKYLNRLINASADLQYKIKTEQLTDKQAKIKWDYFHSQLLASEEKIKDDKSYQKRIAILQIFAAALSQYGKDIQNAYSNDNTYNTGSHNSYDNKYYTGGPLFDWDIFSNGQHRCRTISNGQFAEDILCEYMPLDDDRWPS